VTDPNPAGGPADAGWAWLSTLPRAATAHADRGADPLAAMRGLLAALGNPHTALQVIHIAGSKGKGSTALFCEALLDRLGQRTLTYTSPHLVRWTERFRLDGGEAPPADAFAALDAVREAAARTGIRPGFFEALTAAAFRLAVDAGVDWVVLEAGVGGRADATNIVHPRLSILTSVELEHTDRLGHTRAAIAHEKAGIAKPGAPFLAPELDADVEAVLEPTLTAAGATRVRLRGSAGATPSGTATTVYWHHDAAQPLHVAGAGWTVRTPLGVPGEAMAANAALAVAAIATLGLCSERALQRAARVLADLSLPGRAEVVSTLPWVLVDGAHTAASARALAAVIAGTGASRVHLLVSVSASKDLDSVLGPLLAGADAVTATCADRDYSLPEDEVLTAVRRLAPHLPVTTEADPSAALAQATRDAPGDTLVVATGSVYLAGRVRAAFLG